MPRSPPTVLMLHFYNIIGEPMGNHRFSFHATFKMHGIEDELNLGWCNWSGGQDGIDSRITDWIADVRDRAYAIFHYEEETAMQSQREADERAELVRLKAKYESGD